MLTKEFSYNLPEDLIAQYPVSKRGASRMLVLEEECKISDTKFYKLSEYLKPGDLIVLNDTLVIPARLFLEKESGGKVELILERVLSREKLMVQLRTNKTTKPGIFLFLNNEKIFQVEEKIDDMFLLRYTGEGEVVDLFNVSGHIPLPPYIKRIDDSIDAERYQTVFSNKPGAVAAPTAGLHFTRQMLNELGNCDIDNVKLTLHIGAGTFQPVREKYISKHKIHSEYMSINQNTINKIMETKDRGGRILAVGTTVVRSLESAVKNGALTAYEGETNIFIYPGYKFNVIDMLLTNFHLPESTLLMLVCAFAGKENAMKAYHYAIKEKYKFYSYGDAMLIMSNNNKS